MEEYPRVETHVSALNPYMLLTNHLAVIPNDVLLTPSPPSYHPIRPKLISWPNPTDPTVIAAPSPGVPSLRSRIRLGSFLNTISNQFTPSPLPHLFAAGQ